MKNSSNHGIDVVGIRNGKLYVFEIKGSNGTISGNRLSMAQKNVDSFIRSRLELAAQPSEVGLWSNNNVAPQVRKAAQNALDHIDAKKPVATRLVLVEHVFRSMVDGGSTIIYKAWRMLKN